MRHGPFASPALSRTPDGSRIPIGGKTGSGDNRSEKFASSGAPHLVAAINRTASFVSWWETASSDDLG